MKLTSTEELVLRLVAQDGDYELLEWLLQELVAHFPSSPPQKVLDIGRESLKSLLEKSLIELYRQRHDEDQKLPPYELVASDGWDAALENGAWKPDPSANERISAAPTPEGQRRYEGSALR